jgi:rfaE bifunctional protein kinase chain/domain
MTIPEILERIRGIRVLIAGDLCLDRWCTYDPALSEPSRETGIPRTAVVSTVVTPGAAGTIANNLCALHVPVSILTALGEDGFGFELEQALRQRAIGTEFIFRTPAISTFTYTKLINRQTGAEDLPRVDFIQSGDIPANVESALLQRLDTAWDQFDVVIVSDQAETQTGGIITPTIRERICAKAKTSPDKIVWVDSRVRSEHFRHVTVKPNLDEAEAASCRALGRVDFPALREHMQAPLLIVTRGGEGASVVTEASGEILVPGLRIEKPVDICGAGDSFSAGAASALRVTGSPEEAVRFGNIVASITIMKPGTGTASPEEVLSK